MYALCEIVKRVRVGVGIGFRTICARLCRPDTFLKPSVVISYNVMVIEPCQRLYLGKNLPQLILTRGAKKLLSRDNDLLDGVLVLVEDELC